MDFESLPIPALVTPDSLPSKKITEYYAKPPRKSWRSKHENVMIQNATSGEEPQAATRRRNQEGDAHQIPQPELPAVSDQEPQVVTRRQNQDDNIHQTPQPELPAVPEQEPQAVARRQSRDNAINDNVPQPELPTEVWHHILESMSPSQLTQVALTSRTFYWIVDGHAIWKNIVDTYPHLNRVRDEEEMEQRYFPMVLSHSRFICERCFGHSPGIGSHSALPVFIDTERKILRLCLACRQTHYDAHPEPNEGQGRDYRVYGGEIGLLAELDHLVELEERRVSGHIQRRRMLEITLGSMGIEMDENQTEERNFILHGNGRGLNEAVGQILERHGRNARRELLENRLNQVGLRLRDNSRICHDYIRNGVGNIDWVVTTMVEIDWFLRETVYRSLDDIADQVDEMGSGDESDSQGSEGEELFWQRTVRTNAESDEEQRTAALRDYIHQRLSERRWNDVSTDEDTPSRPPQSLWQQIRILSRQIWLEQTGGHYITATIRQFESLFLTFNPMDINSLSNELLRRYLDFGVLEATNDGSQHQPNPHITFSNVLESFLGEEEFADCLNALRRIIFHRDMSKAKPIKENVMEGVVKVYVDYTTPVEKCNDRFLSQSSSNKQLEQDSNLCQLPSWKSLAATHIQDPDCLLQIPSDSHKADAKSMRISRYRNIKLSLCPVIPPYGNRIDLVQTMNDHISGIFSNYPEEFAMSNVDMGGLMQFQTYDLGLALIEEYFRE
ncbi:hypothetical protein BJV82DRAFT_677395 [Fennellomyces sp. T-0311]|nr:hypothetical protein BJV82DRAFT_677395 [Fennellomyces sp. T-0311]